MAIIRKDYLKMGGHKWVISSGGCLPSTGGTGRFCSVCFVGASKNGSHEICRSENKKPSI